MIRSSASLPAVLRAATFTGRMVNWGWGSQLSSSPAATMRSFTMFTALSHTVSLSTKPSTWPSYSTRREKPLAVTLCTVNTSRPAAPKGSSQARAPVTR